MSSIRVYATERGKIRPALILRQREIAVREVVIVDAGRSAVGKKECSLCDGMLLDHQGSSLAAKNRRYLWVGRHVLRGWLRHGNVDPAALIVARYGEYHTGEV